MKLLWNRATNKEEDNELGRNKIVASDNVYSLVFQLSRACSWWSSLLSLLCMIG
jgi:hypothetical protein